MTATALKFFGYGVPAFALIKILSNFFFARDNTKTPFYISIFIVSINIFISVILGVIPYVITYNLVTKFIVTKDITQNYIAMSALLIALEYMITNLLMDKNLLMQDSTVAMQILFTKPLSEQQIIL